MFRTASPTTGYFGVGSGGRVVTDTGTRGSGDINEKIKIQILGRILKSYLF